MDRAKKAAIKEIKPVNCPTSRRTAVGACGTAFQLGGVVHSCKWLDDHEGAHYCDCVAEGSHFPVEEEGLLETFQLAAQWLSGDTPNEVCERVYAEIAKRERKSR